MAEPVMSGTTMWRDTYSSKLWRRRDGVWEIVPEIPPGFTEADIANLHETIHGLLKRMILGDDSEGNRLRELQYAGANEMVIEWIMRSTERQPKEEHDLSNRSSQPRGRASTHQE